MITLVHSLEYEPKVYVHLEDYHYSAVEGSCFEVCVVAINHSPEELTFTVWIHIESMFYSHDTIHALSSATYTSSAT